MVETDRLSDIVSTAAGGRDTGLISEASSIAMSPFETTPESSSEKLTRLRGYAVE